MNTHSREDDSRDPRSDAQLMLGVRGGDLHALGVLFLRHQKQVHAWCYRMTGDSSVADDLVQETFLRVLRFRHTFQGQSRLTTWLYRIARNVFLDHQGADERRRSVYRSLEQSTGHQNVGDENHRLVVLEEALQRLEHDKREVLILSRYHGMRYDEIAAVCECSVGAVKARAHRAIKELARIYRGLRL